MVRPNEVAYGYIKERILDGTYRPAQHLTEVQLSEEIGVSRNTIKKALLKLSEEKLVVLENNKGAAVFSLTVDEIIQWYEIRRALEKIVVASAALLITENEVKELEAIYRKMEDFKEKEDYPSYSAHNKLFHNVIYKASHKEIAVDQILSIKTQLARFQLRTIMVPGRSDVSIVEHKALLDSLSSHDVDAAVTAITNHLNHVMEAIYKYKALFN